MIQEVRSEATNLQFFRLPGTRCWNDIVFISMGDQSHLNRPPEALAGKVTPMRLLSWRTWKLKRKAAGSNDAEVQSILEAEDQNFRVRMLWSELHGCGLLRPERRADLVTMAEEQAQLVRGVVCTDSRGSYDAVELNESPLLGLSNYEGSVAGISASGQPQEGWM